MKNNNSMFWGIIFLVIGAALILNVLFKLDIPIGKLIVAAIFLYLGLRILFGDAMSFKHFRNEDGNAVFSEQNIEVGSSIQSEYNAVFGKVNVDLRNTEFKEQKTKIVVNAVFGGAEIRLPKDIPVKIKSDVVFGGAKLPEGNSGGFGNYRYKSDDFDENGKYIYVEIHAVFGGVEVYR